MQITIESGELDKKFFFFFYFSSDSIEIVVSPYLAFHLTAEIFDYEILTRTGFFWVSDRNLQPFLLMDKIILFADFRNVLSNDRALYLYYRASLKSWSALCCNFMVPPVIFIFCLYGHFETNIGVWRKNSRSRLALQYWHGDLIVRAQNLRFESWALRSILGPKRQKRLISSVVSP